MVTALLTTLLSILALLAAPGRALADCPVGEVGCVSADRTSGTPGTQVTLWPFGAGCDPALSASVKFVRGDLDETRVYPTAQLTIVDDVEGTRATFVVPSIEPGVYRVGLASCGGDIATSEDNPHALLPFTFTILMLPSTDTAGDGRSFGTGAISAVVGAAVFLVLLARQTRRLGRRG